jgi:hypothetical protein
MNNVRSTGEDKPQRFGNSLVLIYLIAGTARTIEALPGRAARAGD